MVSLKPANRAHLFFFSSSLTLGHDGTSCDAVGDVAQSRVHVEHLGWLCLPNSSARQTRIFQSVQTTYLGVFATFEKWSHAHETNVVIPHDGILALVTGDFEGVLEHCMRNVSIEDAGGV